MKKLTREEQKRKNELQRTFKDDDKSKILAAKKLGAKFWVKIYNVLCMNCKLKVMRNPRLPFNEYCKDCREKMGAVAKEHGIKLK